MNEAEKQAIRDSLRTIHTMEKRHQRDRYFQRSMGTAGPAGALGYYWLWNEVPPLWVFLTWVAFSAVLLFLSFDRKK